MMSAFEQIWASWRREYIEQLVSDENRGAEVPEDECVLCGVLSLRHDDPDRLVHVGSSSAVVLNAYPYTNGHVMVLPFRHVERMSDLEAAERAELFELIDRSVAAIELAYSPDGVNFGANVGRGSGAGIPGHLHVHALPRWEGDTNFMTTIASTRVIPESPDVTLERLRAAFDELA